MPSHLRAMDIAHQLGKAGRAGKGWQACCPAHNDKNPSLLLYDRPDGSVWVKCQAGCDFREVRAALVRLGLWPTESQTTSRKASERKAPQSADAGDTRVVWPVPADAPRPDWGQLLGWSPTAVHIYLDPEHQPLFFVARRDRPGEGKDIRPVTLWRQPDGGLSWATRAPPEPRPLYGLDQLAARPDASVLVVEGEKAADAARAVFPDYVVVTWPGGANAIDKADWSPLAGRKVVAWPDNDEAGRKAMQQLAARLTGESA